jgi:2'-5' RNA ligase
MIKTVRVFIAVELPEDVKAGLAAIQLSVSRAGRDVVRWAAPEGMHVTLKFLGEIPESMVKQVADVMETAVVGFPKFGLATGELGFFPSPNRPRVFWIGLKGDLPALLHLQESVETATESLGFTREARGFSPHLTLARFRDDALPVPSREFVHRVGLLGAPESRLFTVDGISLMKSTLTPKGAIYSQLFRVELARS